MRAGLPLVSIVLPTLNEERDIGGCLDAIAAQTYPADCMELLVVDGESDDRTVEKVGRRAPSLGLHRAVVLKNPKRRTSTSLNVGLTAARGDVVVRLDARSRVEPHYVGRVVELLSARRDVGVVGGAQIPLPRTTRTVDRGIARGLANRWGTGLARYRRSADSGATDTVWMGAFRTEELRALGGWDPAVALNEDFELNARYRANGSVVWFDGNLRSSYLPRPDLVALARQYFRFGMVKGTWWARNQRPNVRQALLLATPICAAIVAWLSRRRWGTAPVVIGGAGVAVVVDHAGSRDGGAAVAVRIVSISAIATMSVAWWSGVITGFMGELAGVEHQHG